MADIKLEKQSRFNVSGEIALWVAIVSWIVAASLGGFQSITKLHGGDPSDLAMWATTLSYVGVVFALYGAVAFKFKASPVANKE